jgi:hypothetical protein
MPNRLIETTLRPEDGVVAPLSRYLTAKIIYYGDNNVQTFKTYKKQIIPNDSQDTFDVVPAGMEFRPDLVSRKAYGVPDFWWKIMEANGLMDIMDFKAGLNIRLPHRVY